MTAATIHDHLLGIFLPFSTMKAIKQNAKKANAKRKLDKGIKLILEGLQLSLEGLNEFLEDTIETLMREQSPSLSDADLAEAIELLDQMSSFKALLQEEAGFPKLLINECSKCIERYNMYLNIERQMHDNLAVPTKIDIEELHKVIKKEKKEFAITWVEA
ncbi:hypothetical protein [Shewanella sp. SR43-8]|uniref:hypothetical protein n=1 Tax=Shewanella sp. SR43-8 TaxID=2760938 RepID=UPI001603D14D|nr:hypothetical protein [Shewanella sp. SR43-8]MBB1322112.1 hypothetical protein [Shewanella sp. SR43-8]